VHLSRGFSFLYSRATAVAAERKTVQVRVSSAAMKTAALLRSLLCLILLCPVRAAAEEKKPTLTEAKAEFAKADRALNAAWEAVKKKFSGPEMERLKEEQRGWVEYRDYMALAPGYSGAPAEEARAKVSAEYFAAAAGLTEERVRFLQGMLAPPGETLTGSWTDSYGGLLEVVEKDGKLHFRIAVVRSHAVHVGQLAGVADWNERIGWFSDKDRQKDRQEVANVAFLLRDNGRLELAGANTQHYHGVRAHFDGEYVRTGTLDAGRRAEVLKAAATGEYGD